METKTTESEKKWFTCLKDVIFIWGVCEFQATTLLFIANKRCWQGNDVVSSLDVIFYTVILLTLLRIFSKWKLLRWTDDA